MKVSELTGAALDWAVAKCEGYFNEQPAYWATAAGVEHFMDMRGEGVHWTHSSTDWSQGGPIVEREGIAVSPEIDCIRWYGSVNGGFLDGPTPLIAAMRCYVASKLGDEVDVPKELM